MSLQPVLAGLESGFDEAQGRRETMEDAHCVINDAKTHADLAGYSLPFKHIAFWGVFDGHGGVRFRTTALVTMLVGF